MSKAIFFQFPGTIVTTLISVGSLDSVDKFTWDVKLFQDPKTYVLSQLFTQLIRSVFGDKILALFILLWKKTVPKYGNISNCFLQSSLKTLFLFLSLYKMQGNSKYHQNFGAKM